MVSFVFITGQILIMTACITLVASGTHNTPELEGHPVGYLADCPNITKPLSKEDLKKIFFVVRGAGSGKKIKYNYYQMGLMAKDRHMDWSKKTVLYVGGYMSSPSHPDGRIMEQLYAQMGYNVWLLDEFAFLVGVYPYITRRVRITGAHAGEMLAELTNLGVLDISKFEMIGVSLGGHTMSYIAKRYFQVTGKKISRITAFDPSGPCFRGLGPEYRLDKSDAQLVTVIMTNIDAYGLAVPVGHVNFYVNGGEYQVFSQSYLACTDLCSHVKSFLIWMAAVQHQDEFIGIKCNSIQQARNRDCYDNVPRITNVLSPKTDPTKPGIYYLSTSNRYPFYLGKKGLVRKHDFSVKALKFAFEGL